MSFKRNGDAWVEMGLGRRGEGHRTDFKVLLHLLKLLALMLEYLANSMDMYICLVDTLDKLTKKQNFLIQLSKFNTRNDERKVNTPEAVLFG